MLDLCVFCLAACGGEGYVYEQEPEVEEFPLVEERVEKYTIEAKEIPARENFRVLWVGNSLTFVGDVPRHFSDIAIWRVKLYYDVI